MRFIVLSFGFSLIFLFAFHPINAPANKVQTIVIDAGHGDHDPGTSGKISKEKDVALDIALELGRILEENLPDVQVVYTRKTDKFVELHQRAIVANKAGADLFVSIHCNAFINKAIFGTETYVMGLNKTLKNLNVAKRENSSILLEKNHQENYDGFDPDSDESYILFSLYQNAYLKQSLQLGANIESQMAKRAGRNSRGVRQAPFLVLWRTTMPSVLVETGYLSNAKEERELNDELNQIYIASGIYRAIRDYKSDLESLN